MKSFIALLRSYVNLTEGAAYIIWLNRIPPNETISVFKQIISQERTY